MKKFSSFLLALFLFQSSVFSAVAPDFRISDNDGNVLNINSNGTVAVEGAGAVASDSAVVVHLDGSASETFTGDTAPEDASVAADAGDYITVGNGSYPIGANIIDFKSNQTWNFQNVTITHTATASPIIRLSAVTKCRILGSLKLTGLGAGGLTGEFGIQTTGASYGHIIQNVWADDFADTSFAFSGVASVTHEGSQMENLTATSSNVGYLLSIGSEYNVLTNCIAFSNSDGYRINGGNNRFVNCHATSNAGSGALFAAGSNHAHGSWIGGAFNHNTTYNVYMDSITLGFTFVGTHFFGDSSSAGKIYLKACAGVDFLGGDLSSAIEANGTLAGMNTFSNMHVFNPTTTVVLTATAEQRKLIRFQNNYTDNGEFYLNDSPSQLFNTQQIGGWSTNIPYWFSPTPGKMFLTSGLTTFSRTDGDTVGGLSDYFGLGVSLIEATNTPSLDLVDLNGVASDDFDGTNDILSWTGDISTATSGSVTFVIRPTTITGGAIHTIFATNEAAAANNYMWCYIDGTAARIKIALVKSGGGIYNLSLNTTAIAINTAYVVTISSDGSTLTGRINGVAQTMSVNSGTNQGDWFGDISASTDNFDVGAFSYNGGTIQSFFNGSIGDIDINDNLTIASTPNAIMEEERKLAKKYRIAIV